MTEAVGDPGRLGVSPLSLEGILADGRFRGSYGGWHADE